MTSQQRLPARRRFLTTAGAGVASLMGTPRYADSSEGSAVDEPRVQLVKDFLRSWPRGMKTVLSYLAEDCEYRLTQWGPNRTGHAAIAEDLSMNVDRPRAIITKIFDCSNSGPIVMAHYENCYVYEDGDFIWEGASTFLIKEKKIQEWRSYTIRVGNHTIRT